MQLIKVLLILSGFLACAKSNFNAQLTQVKSLIDMENSKLSFGTNPGQYLFMDGDEDNISDVGVIAATNQDRLGIISVDWVAILTQYTVPWLLVLFRKTVYILCSLTQRFSL